MKINHSIAVAGLILLSSCGLPASRADVVLYSQVAGPTAGLGFFSMTATPAPRPFKHADDFSLLRAATLTRVRWWGLSEGRLADDLRNFNSYTIEVFRATGAIGAPLPQERIFVQTFPSATISITPTGRIAESGAVEHVYETGVSGLSMDSSTPYLIAISAGSPTSRGDAWMWQDGRFVNGHSAVLDFRVGNWTAFQDTDSAFELIGVEVPAPSAGNLTLALVLGSVARRRRPRA
jgi:hypothetical protein